MIRKIYISTVKDCDEILVLDKGNLVECGNHTRLMELNGYYAHLYKQQNL
ncbi:hypothetical protein [Campylobacter sp. 2018MI13]|nr:hypothetical protein [Campylobacter sp. 2018MI13]MBT0883564.1 hypothetical protein [Campylobacter sp. 2018MI13]